MAECRAQELQKALHGSFLHFLCSDFVFNHFTVPPDAWELHQMYVIPLASKEDPDQTALSDMDLLFVKHVKTRFYTWERKTACFVSCKLEMSVLIPCLKQKEFAAFSTCFPQDLQLLTALEKLLGLLQYSDHLTIICIKPGQLDFIPGIQHDVILYSKKEVYLDTITSQSGFFYSLKGKLFVLPEELTDEVKKLFEKTLSQQKQKLFQVKFDDLTNASLNCVDDKEFETIRKRSFEASYHYNLACTSRRGQKRTFSKSCGTDRHLNDKPISLKSKHLRFSNKDKVESSLKKRRSGLLVNRLKYLLKKKYKQHNLNSRVQKETLTDKTRYAKQYVTTRTAKVNEDHSYKVVSTKPTTRVQNTKHPLVSGDSLSKFFKKRKASTVLENKIKVENISKENDLPSVNTGRKKKRGDEDQDDYTAWLQDRTNLPHSENPLYRQVIQAYPGRRTKPSSSARSHGHGTDKRPEQVSPPERVTNLPPPEQIVTSTISIYRQNHFVQYPPPTTNSMTFTSEQELALRLHGLANRRHGRPPQPAKHPQFADAAARRASFSQWPSTVRQDSNAMTNYGFFYTGRADLIRCFQCGIGLKDWSEPDEPLFEHIKHSPDCSFLLQLLGPDLLAAYKVNLVPGSSQPAAARPPPVEGPSDGEAVGATGGASLTPTVRSPQYAELSARLRSFNNFGRSITQTPSELAEAGFYYTGEGDICRCFTCDGGLTRWDPQDDPWVEHAKWFPRCSYVRQVKGDEYVNLIQQAVVSSGDENATGGEQSSVAHGIAQMSVDTPSNPLATAAAQTALEMGYSKKAVNLAIHELIAKNKTSYKAEDIVGVLTGKQDRGEALPTDTPPNEQSTGAEGSEADEHQQLEQDNKRLKNILKCIRCETRLANMLFMPCTHHKLCEECAQDVSMCPVCGRSVADKIKTYMS